MKSWEFFIYSSDDSHVQIRLNKSNDFVGLKKIMSKVQWRILNAGLKSVTNMFDRKNDANNVKSYQIGYISSFASDLI